MSEHEPRVFIEIEVGDDVGLHPGDLDLPADIDAAGVIAAMKAQSNGIKGRCIRDWNLLQDPVILVAVNHADGRTTREQW